jgi:hypothetical protein
MLGSAVGGVVIFVVSVYGYFWYQFARVGPGAEISLPTRSEKVVTAAPPIVDVERFHGSTGVFTGEFPVDGRHAVLAAGPARLVGTVTSSGKPVEGLRVRLALNGAVMSQWATSGADGKYRVALPAGTYRIDGYELDSQSAHRVLRGKIDGPRHGRGHRMDTIAVTEASPGEAIDLAFVDPVRKKGPKGEVPAAPPVVFSWEPYAGATYYRLQVVEQKDPRDYETHRRVFPYRNQPLVSGTSVNLAEQGVALKKGYYYTVEVEALDENRRKLSESPRSHDRADFRVAD